MKRIHLLVPAVLVLGLAAGSAGCVVSSGVGVRAHASYSAPEMVLVEPGLYVVYDYHEPVFYSDGYYWRYQSGLWYRSHYHSHGWVRWSSVPHRVRRIDRPHYYVNYRGHGRGQVRGGHRGYRNDRPVVRDHRRGGGYYGKPSGHGAVRGQAGGTTVRDHRSTVKVKSKSKSRSKSSVKVRDHRRK